jgi:hypothetical protein
MRFRPPVELCRFSQKIPHESPAMPSRSVPKTLTIHGFHTPTMNITDGKRRAKTTPFNGKPASAEPTITIAPEPTPHPRRTSIVSRFEVVAGTPSTCILEGQLLPEAEEGTGLT